MLQAPRGDASIAAQQVKEHLEEGPKRLETDETGRAETLPDRFRPRQEKHQDYNCKGLNNVIVPIQHLLRALDPPLCRDKLSGTPVDSNPYHKRGNKRDSHAGQDFSFDRNQLKKKG
jgi:hypothetical protein